MVTIVQILPLTMKNKKIFGKVNSNYKMVLAMVQLAQ